MPRSSPTFEILSRLGTGGMGEVFLAVMKKDGAQKKVALKRLRADSGPVSDRYPLFEREAQICSLLQHPNVVRLEAYGFDDKGPYLALELVEGESASALLREYVRLEQELPLKAAFSLALDAAVGLAYAHAQGVVHRDVSPDNVLVSFAGLAKVTDFGVAKVVGGETLTSTGVVVGKHGYLAPELFDGQ